jgi:hypothetical protein
MAAGSADKPPLPEVLILFMLEERGPLVQIGQVINVFLRRIFPGRSFGDGGQRFSFSESLAMPIRLERNLVHCNPCLESHLKTMQLLIVNSQPKTIACVTTTKHFFEKP